MTPPPATTRHNPPATHRARPITGRARARRAAQVRSMAAAVLVASLVGGLAAGVAPAIAATDDPTEDGLWYYTVPGFPEIHASGITGEGITVAVIDGPIYPHSPDLAGTNLILPDTSFCDADRDGIPDPVTSTARVAVHATGLAAVLIGTGVGVDGQPGVQGVAPGATVRPYVRTSTGGVCTLDGQDGVALSIDQAISDGVEIINLSFGGNRWDEEELAALARAQRAGIIVVAASNNGEAELGWPARANGVIAVEAADVHGVLHPAAVSDPYLTVVAPGVDMRVLYDKTITTDWRDYLTTSGSSLATAWVSGALALAWSAHPEATANQMIQALLRTTSQSDGDLTRVDDHWGYGMVNARDLVAIDPTTLPDINPLLRDDPDAQPSYQDIVGPEPEPEPTPEPTGAPEPEPTHAAPPPADTATGGLPLALIITLGGAIILAGAITTVVLLRRPTTPATSPATTTGPPGAGAPGTSTPSAGPSPPSGPLPPSGSSGSPFGGGQGVR